MKHNSQRKEDKDPNYGFGDAMILSIMAGICSPHLINSGNDLEKIIGVGSLVAMPIITGYLGLTPGAVYANGKQASKSMSFFGPALASTICIATTCGLRYISNN